MEHLTADDWLIIRQLLGALRQAGKETASSRNGEWGHVASPEPQCTGERAASGATGMTDERASDPAGTSPCPDPDVIRHLIHRRQKQREIFGPDLVANPVWDILLDLTAAYCEGRQVSVTSLCIASGVPQSTSLRWIGRMVENGMLERIDDPLDRRRSFVRLSRRTVRDMLRYLAVSAPPGRASSPAAVKPNMAPPPKGAPGLRIVSR